MGVLSFITLQYKRAVSCIIELQSKNYNFLDLQKGYMNTWKGNMNTRKGNVEYRI